MTHILVTRAAAARWRTLGTVTEAPLLTIAPRLWQPPPTMPDAIAFTSANGVRFAGPDAERYRSLPAFSVGGATAHAARDAGWLDVRDGGGTAATLFAAAAAAGFASVLHLAGVDRTIVAMPSGLRVEICEVYSAELVDLPVGVLAQLASGAIDLVVLYSPRSAAEFARQVDAAAVARAGIRLAALSPAIAVAAGAGWREIVTAATPEDDALFAAAATLCDKHT